MIGLGVDQLVVVLGGVVGVRVVLVRDGWIGLGEIYLVRCRVLGDEVVGIA